MMLKESSTYNVTEKKLELMGASIAMASVELTGCHRSSQTNLEAVSLSSRIRKERHQQIHQPATQLTGRCLENPKRYSHIITTTPLTASDAFKRCSLLGK